MAKYDADQLKALGAKGHAFKNPDGTFSYPIDDVADLKNAIHAVGRSGSDHDAVRKYVIGRAKALGQSDLIPDNWAADGSLKEKDSVWVTAEQRESYNDLSSMLQTAISASLPADNDGEPPYVWVQDFTDAWVVYQHGGELMQAAYTVDGDTVTLGTPTKVRTVTSYVPVQTNSAKRAAGHSHAHKHGDSNPHDHIHTHGAGNYAHGGDDLEVGHTHGHVEANSARDDGTGPDGDDNLDAAGGADLCPTCMGAGQTDDGTECPDCDGSGLAAEGGEPARAARPARSRRPAAREVRTMAVEGLEMRTESGGTVKVSGYACRTGVAYPVTDFLGSYNETVRSGAFKKTLADGADVRFLINHDGLPLARTKSGTLSLQEDSRGLRVEAELDPASPLVQQLRSALAREDVDQMSFAFQAVRQSWDADYENRDILEAKLMDVSAVTYPASPTTTIGLRAAAARNAARALPSARLEALRAELRAGAPLSAATSATMNHILDLVAAADDAVDKAQPLLADLLGVPNPDKAHVVSGPADSVDEANSVDLKTYEARMRALDLTV